MAEVLFPAYRAYSKSRVEVNDAMTALLVGSRLAAHTLSLTAGSSATLGQLFPAVEHVTRFNMRSDVARDYLNQADHHIASVAVPYALATHEDFVMGMIDLLTGEGRTIVKRDKGKQIKAWNMHAVLFDTCGEAEPEDWIQSFHVLREMRNCITHAGGGVDQKLRDCIGEMGTSARAGWQSINGGPPEDIEGPDGQLVLTTEHVFSAFAVTKRLGREINGLLAREFNADTWARIAVEDYQSQTTKLRNSSQWRRSLTGYVRQNYGTIRINEAQIEAAARYLGLWTLPSWK